MRTDVVGASVGFKNPDDVSALTGTHADDLYGALDPSAQSVAEPSLHDRQSTADRRIRILVGRVPISPVLIGRHLFNVIEVHGIFRLFDDDVVFWPIGDTGSVNERNVLGGTLEPCGTDPVTGYYRDGCCTTGPEDLGSHTICAVVTAEFLQHQRSIGNDLSTPIPQYGFPGLVPGDRWCVTAGNWLRAHNDGAAAFVVLASTHERALEIVPLEALREHAVDVPLGPGNLDF